MKLDFTKHGTDSATPATGSICCLIGIILIPSSLYTLFTSETSDFLQLLELLAFGVFCLVAGFGLLHWNWKRSND